MSYRLRGEADVVAGYDRRVELYEVIELRVPYKHRNMVAATLG